MTTRRFWIPSRSVVRHVPEPSRRLAGRCHICRRGTPWPYGTVCAGLRLSFLKSSDFRLFARSGFGTVLHGNGAVRPRLCRRQAAAALRAAAKSSCQSLIRACARHGFKRGPACWRWFRGRLFVPVRRRGIGPTRRVSGASPTRRTATVRPIRNRFGRSVPWDCGLCLFLPSCLCKNVTPGLSAGSGVRHV